MENLIELIAFLVFGTATLLSRRARRKRLKSEELENSTNLTPPIDLSAQPIKTSSTAKKSNAIDDISYAETSQNSATKKQVNFLAELKMSSETARQAIILSEIIGKPKSLRNA